MTKHIDRPLAQDMRAVAAYVGVRNTHSGPIRETIADPDTGQQYMLSGRNIQYTGPVELSKAVADGTRTRFFVCSTQKQRDDLLHALRAAGGNHRVVAQEIRPMYFIRPPQLLPKFGGDDTFRALGHLALNFLAVHFPEAARDPALERFKRFVLFGDGKGFVDFDYGWQKGVEPNRFLFGHRVVVGVAEDGGIVGAVSLFGVYDVSIRFGSATGRRSEFVMVEIDPLAESIPNDMVASKLPTALDLSVTSGIEAAAAVSARFGEFQRLISDRAWERDRGGLVLDVNSIRNLPPGDRPAELARILTPQLQRILNVAAGLSRWCAEKAAADVSGAGKMLSLFFETAFEEDAHHLAERSEMLLLMIRDAIVDRLVVELATGPISSDTLRACLEGQIAVDESLRAFSSIATTIAVQIAGSESRKIGPVP